MKRRLKRALIAASLAGAAIAGTTGLAIGYGADAGHGPPPAPPPGAPRPLPGAHAARPRYGRPRTSGLLLRRTRPRPGTQPSIRRHPLGVGNLDGAPVRVRYQANKLALRRTRGRPSLSVRPTRN